MKPGKLYRATKYMPMPFDIQVGGVFMCVDYKPSKLPVWSKRSLSNLTVLYKLKTLDSDVYNDQIHQYVEEIY